MSEKKVPEKRCRNPSVIKKRMKAPGGERRGLNKQKDQKLWGRVPKGSVGSGSVRRKSNKWTNQGGTTWYMNKISAVKEKTTN